MPVGNRADWSGRCCDEGAPNVPLGGKRTWVQLMLLCDSSTFDALVHMCSSARSIKPDKYVVPLFHSPLSPAHKWRLEGATSCVQQSRPADAFVRGSVHAPSGVSPDEGHKSRQPASEGCVSAQHAMATREVRARSL